MDELKSKLKNLVKNNSIKNFFWLSSDKVFKLLISLIVGAWTARYLGPSNLGKLNYIYAYITILTAVSSLGMDSFLIKEILESKSEKNKILGTSFVLRFLASIISIGVIYLILLISKLDTELYHLYYLMVIPILLSPFELIDIEYQSRLQSKKTIISKNIGYVIGTGLKIYILVIGKSLIWFALVIAVEAFISYLFLVVSYQLNHNIRQWQFDKDRISSLLKSIWPFALSGLSIILYMRLDQIMLGNIMGDKSVGQFSAAVKITEIFMYLPMAISSSYYPSLIKAKEISYEYFHSKILSYFRVMTTFSISISLLLFVFSYLIIKTIYGIQYLEAVDILKIHCWTLFPVFLGIASGQYLVIEGLQKIIFYRTLIGLITNVILNIVLIPQYGGIGAAFATVISYLFSAILSNLFFKKTRLLLFLSFSKINK
jgi:PST family polysaccharide transporter